MECIIRRGLSEDEIPKDTKETYNLLRHLYGFTARMSELPNMITKSTGIPLDIDVDLVWSPIVLSRLLDFQKAYSIGESIDASEFKNFIYSFLGLTRREKQSLDKCNVELKLWSILMILTEPSLSNFNIK